MTRRGWVLAGLSSAAPTFLGYAALCPTAQVFGPSLSRGSPARNIVALTFDDGPNEPYTSRLLDLLKEEKVPATFFLIGRNAEAFPDTVRRVAQEGHEIGNHSYTHPPLALQGKARIASELDRTQEILAGLTGLRPVLFRPPFGLRDWRVMEAARTRGLKAVFWSDFGFDIASGRWQRGARAIAARIEARASPGGIILMHDGDLQRRGADKSQSVEAARRVIGDLRLRGYRFVTVSELLDGAAAP